MPNKTSSRSILVGLDEILLRQGTDKQGARTGKVDEVEAAVGALAGDVGDAVHDDGEHGVGAAAALIHLGLGHRPVARADLHHLQHFFSTPHIHLRAPQPPMSPLCYCPY